MSEAGCRPQTLCVGIIGQNIQKLMRYVQKKCWKIHTAQSCFKLSIQKSLAVKLFVQFRVK
ncbi:hypothetical protein DSCA_33770 [Desulfosarcina alkanivorans]|uniref:Uncharacterized protein n=1 Tax=Desulfosarcina alkanivorans TaxID=571177 RepID=A0A5K7YXP1_9BACT|nr:hypothetical protein DSCA_33770 [Desulfosarcina alkanivorans]